MCEDAWHSLVPTLAALDGAQILIVPSASPARGVTPDPERAGAEGRPETVRRWEEIVRRIAEEHGVFVIVAQLAGFEGGKGLQGGSVVIDPSGTALARGPLFDPALVSARLQLRALTRARFESPLLADLEVQLLNLLRHLDDGARSQVEFDAADECPPSVRPAAAVGHLREHPLDQVDPMAVDAALLERWLTTFLRYEVQERRGFRRVIVGLSGGVDSATTAALAVRALGPEAVIGVRMPYRTSSPESLADAQLVAERLGIELTTVDISAAVDGYLQAADPDADATRRGNVMARLRMVTLFDLSAKLAALPLGTGNKTERLLGYFTWHADDSPPVNPLGDLFKTQVWALARHLGVPDEIVEKPATADLVRGQTDEADLGISYDKADRILHWLLSGASPDEIAARGFTPSEVGTVRGRLEGTHWKRRLPAVAMVSATAIGETYLRPVDY